MILGHASLALAMFQGTQLDLFERFLTQAVCGITSTGVIAGMQKAAYIVLLIGFLWQVYQSALHGGDVRGLGVSLTKYVVTAVVVMNYSTIFTTVNQGFVNAGDWVNSTSGAANLFDSWKTDLQTEFSQIGYQKLWGIITGDIAGLIDGALIIIAYLLYPIVIAVFGFFYIFYGSVLYIFGPIVISLMPLGATNRIAKAYVENVFIWNAWPILYGGFGALLSAVQMGQIGQMLNQNNFLGGLGNIEGSILIGLASIIYSLAIAVIPFIAKRIVSGDVGSTAAALIGAAATAATMGAATVEGAAAGAAARSAGAPSGASGAGSAASAGAATPVSASPGSNQPTPSQAAPRAAASADSSESSSPSISRMTTDSSSSHGPSLEGHAEQMRNSFANAMGGAEGEGESLAEEASDEQAAGQSAGREGQPAAQSSSPVTSRNYSRSAAPAKRGPTVHRFNVGTWSAFHAARIATKGVTGVAGKNKGSEKERRRL